MAKKQLHQILAVEANIVGKMTIHLNEMAKIFRTKVNLFIGQVRRYTGILDNTPELPHEDKHRETTVQERINYVKQSMINAINVSCEKEATNAVAKADIKIGENIVAENVPVTALLNLETKLTNIKNAMAHIPTLDNGVEWTTDENGISSTNKVKAFRTSKEKDFKVVVEPTEFHKAHVEPVTKDVNVGYWETHRISGEYSSAQKAELLNKLEVMIVAVKSARAKANQCEVIHSNVGDKVIAHIFG